MLGLLGDTSETVTFGSELLAVYVSGLPALSTPLSGMRVDFPPGTCVLLIGFSVTVEVMALTVSVKA